MVKLHHKAGLLNNVGVHLGDGFSRTEALADLEEAIKVGREAVEATPINSPDRAGRLNNLGIRLNDKFSRTGALADLEEAKQSFATSLGHLNAAINVRLQGGRRFLSIPHISSDKSAFEIAEQAINLIPLLSTRSLPNSDRRHLLSQISGLSSDAAAVALCSKKSPAIAIELLETGRAVIAGDNTSSAISYSPSYRVLITRKSVVSKTERRSLTKTLQVSTLIIYSSANVAHNASLVHGKVQSTETTRK
ncbi:uncharacterized protein PgNI_12562 [Pyricularia grisea]|uniref:Uncharacterized protein n=1 Tax=Pyricularia grisea TaxID=148305 RepID=A0A6P8AM50_PYRGI|nr:uncharacterized protein PgNI_12562 [Pyricularia grisea]TLD03110.1 hypothetical protein PgNI_12562 [Pyricularia grisea]